MTKAPLARALEALDGEVEARRSMRRLFVSASSLVDQLEAPDWLLEDVYARGQLHLVFGAPKSGKSALVLDQSLSIVLGLEWGGLRTDPAPVFILAGEGHSGINRRIAAWSIANGHDLGGAPLFISARAVPLPDEGVAGHVADTVSRMSVAHGLPGLVVIDTLARNFGGRDENTAKDMGAFVAACDEIRVSTGAGIVIVHHTPIAQAERSRGSGALPGAIDASYSVTVEGVGIVRWQSILQKDSPTSGTSRWRLTSQAVPLLDKWDRVSTAVVPQFLDTAPVIASTRAKEPTGKNQKLALRLLRKMYEECDENFAKAGRTGAIARVEEMEWRARFNAHVEASNPRAAWGEAREALVNVSKHVVVVGRHAFLAERNDWQLAELGPDGLS